MLKDLKIKLKGTLAAKRKLHVKPRFMFICSGVLMAGLVLILIFSSLTAESQSALAQAQASISLPAPSATSVPAMEASESILLSEILPSEPTSAPTPVQLKQGVTSDEVIKLQERLMELDYMEQDLPTDYFGPATEYSLELFQRKHGLQIDGILGEETKQLLFSDQAKKYTVSIGFSGTDVREIQLRLQELDFLQKVTDYFGDETEAAVKEFQSRNGLTVDGSVGSQTKEILFSNEAKAFYYSIGTSGDEVLKLQKRLFALGYLTTEPDGPYGKDTENAIKRFQQKNGFIDDGYAGPETRTMLFSDEAERNALGMGDSGGDVQNIQQRLIELKYLKDKADGYFGSNTVGAVKAFQKRNGLSQDGKVGSQTLNVLLSDSAKKAPSSSGGSSSSNNGSSSQEKSVREKSVDALIEVAKSKLGAKYVLGAKGPNTFDCSGFVYWCLNQIGVKQGYMTSGGWAATSKYPKIENMKDLRAGDIISFKGHVGIALGGGKMIDSAPSGGGVRIGDLSNSYWIKNFIRGYRVL
jgi:peptidoglycan hydrolase-like protein with peptidoglycan-binding domain